MSYSLLREIDVYICNTDSTDSVHNIAVLSDVNIRLEANIYKVFAYELGIAPNMLALAAIDQISPVAMSFTTYVKPSYLDDIIGSTSPDKLLYDSLGGIEGFRGPGYYSPQFGKVNRLLPLWIYLKTTTSTYKISYAYVKSVEFVYDINNILTSKWEVLALSIESLTNVEFTNIKNYKAINNYLRPKFTNTTIQDSYINKTYKIPIISASIKIDNILSPIIYKNVKIVTGIPTDILISGRSVSGRLVCYLSGKSNHSRDFLKDNLNNLDMVNNKKNLLVDLTDANKSLIINIPFAILNIPNLDIQEVITAEISFESSESVRGLNDDIDIKFKYNPTSLTTEEYIIHKLSPDLYYKFDDVGDTIINYGTLGTSYNLLKESGTYTSRNSGPYINSYSYELNCNFNTTSVKPLRNSNTIAFWVNLDSSVNYEVLLDILYDTGNSNRLITITRQYNNNIYIRILNTDINFTITFNTWHFIVLNINWITSEYSVYFNNNNILSGTVPSTGLDFYPEKCRVGGTSNASNISQVLVFPYNINEEEIDILYNITDIYDYIEADYVIESTEYSDTLLVNKTKNTKYSNYLLQYGPKRYWRCNDNNNSYLVDYVNNSGLNLYNNPVVGIDGPLYDSSCKAVRFSHFNTTQQYALEEGTYTNTQKSWTYVFWVNILSKGSSSSPLIKASESSQYTHTPLYYNSNTSMYYVSTRDDIIYGSAIDLDLNTWYFMAVSYDESSDKIYVYRNGTLIQTVNSVPSMDVYYPTSPRFYINKNNISGNSFEVSEIAIFDKLLSHSAISNIYISSDISKVNQEVFPSTGNIYLSSNQPSVINGIIITVINENINIIKNTPIITFINNILPDFGSLIYYRVFNKLLPIIINTKQILPTTQVLNIIKNIPSVRAYRFIFTEDGSVNINGFMPTVAKIIDTYAGEIQVNGEISAVLIIVNMITPSVGNINVVSEAPIISYSGGPLIIESQIIFI